MTDNTKKTMRKGKKVKAEIRLDSNRSMKIEGRVSESRFLFGREECLIEVDKVAPLWVTREKLS